jgi:hypothetical protein
MLYPAADLGLEVRVTHRGQGALSLAPVFRPDLIKPVDPDNLATLIAESR